MRNSLFLLLLVANFSFAQTVPNFELTKQGLAPIVLDFKGKTAEEIYKKSIKWVKEYYRNPAQALKADIANEKIRIEGYRQDAWSINAVATFYYAMSYSIELEFKDDKARMTFYVNDYIQQTNSKNVGADIFFKNSGEIKSRFSKAKVDTEASINKIKTDYSNYIISDKNSKKDDW